jgi:hypothetical protein
VSSSMNRDRESRAMSQNGLGKKPGVLDHAGPDAHPSPWPGWLGAREGSCGNPSSLVPGGWKQAPHSFLPGFFKIGSGRTICPGLALNHDPPDLCLPSSWDFRCKIFRKESCAVSILSVWPPWWRLGCDSHRCALSLALLLATPSPWAPWRTPSCQKNTRTLLFQFHNPHFMHQQSRHSHGGI